MADNLLIISGRQNAVLNAGGGKMAAEKVEAAVCMATNKLGVEEVWAAIVCGEKIGTERLRAHCRLRMPMVFAPAHIVTLDALPVTAMGKVDRPRLKQMLMDAAAHS